MKLYIIFTLIEWISTMELSDISKNRMAKQEWNVSGIWVGYHGCKNYSEFINKQFTDESESLLDQCAIQKSSINSLESMEKLYVQI